MSQLGRHNWVSPDRVCFVYCLYLDLSEQYCELQIKHVFGYDEFLIKFSWFYQMLLPYNVPTSSYPGWIKSPQVVTLGILKISDLDSLTIFIGGVGGYSGVNFGHPKSEVFRNGGGDSGLNFGHPKSEVFRNGGGGGYSGLQFQKGVFWKIWTKIYCSARNLLVHHSSLSHTKYVETYHPVIPYPVRLAGINIATVLK